VDVLPLKSYQNNQVIPKVAKTQGSHLEFGKNKNSEMVSWNKGQKILPQFLQTSPCPFN
jgi:hypothetical protein